jgi:hypothetical protein
MNKNHECWLTHRLPGNMTACPLVEFGPVASTPARPEALAGLECLIQAASGPVPLTLERTQQAIDGILPEPAVPVWAETIAREAVAEPEEPALVEVYQIDGAIAELKHRIAALTVRRAEVVEAVIDSGKMDQPDGYGNVYHLQAHDRTVRTLEPDLLRERQPAVFEAIAVSTWTVTIADARRHLGEDEITACSSSRTTRSWLVVCEQSVLVGGLEVQG